MSCSPFDLKDYFLRELPPPQALQVETHIRTCPSCRDELDRLRLTEAALFALREEEIPQRIAFVSDQVFEPSALRRWWAAFWGSAPRLGFASAAMLSAAILVFALTRPAALPPGQPVVKVAAAPPAAVLTPQDVQRQIQAAVAKAMLESRADTVKMVADLERSNEMERRQLIASYEDELARERKQGAVQLRASYSASGEERGGAQ